MHEVRGFLTMARGTPDLERSVAGRRQLLAELLLEHAASDVYPASLAQERLWFLHQLDSESPAYNIHLGIWLQGRLDKSALQASLQEIVGRHDSLRTCFR